MGIVSPLKEIAHYVRDDSKTGKLWAALGPRNNGQIIKTTPYQGGRGSTPIFAVLPFASCGEGAGCDERATGRETRLMLYAANRS
jgi:hypothetical protein